MSANYIELTPDGQGQVYSWANIKLIAGTHFVVGIVSIDYGDTQDTEDVYAVGVRPYGRGYGNIKATCKLGLYMEEVVELQTASITGNINDIPEFDIICQSLRRFAI